jgi:peptidoglycan/xylan/chitin deacetylase (PgdA/CDA1 family)
MQKISSNISRRKFIITSALGVTAIGLGLSPAEKRKFLIRIDTESRKKIEMKGFFNKIITVQRRDNIPISFFCLGAAIELREEEFKNFFNEVKDDPLFDIQDHSYSHIGLGYQNGEPIDVLKADYEKSFSVHERVFRKRPIGISMCGTGGRNGPLLCGFDATEKSRAELEMLSMLGIKMINTNLCTADSTADFINYSKIGHPEIMGFPNGLSDTGWLKRKKYGDPKIFIQSQIVENAKLNNHMAIMLHDHIQWIDMEDKELNYLITIAEYAREQGYELATHIECYNHKNLWQ